MTKTIIKNIKLEAKQDMSIEYGSGEYEFQNCDLSNVDFSKCDLSKITFFNCNLQGAIAQINKSDWTFWEKYSPFKWRIDKGNVTFLRPSMSEIEEYSKQLNNGERNFSIFMAQKRKIYGKLIMVDLDNRDFSESLYENKIDLRNADLTGTCMRNADFSGIDLTGAILPKNIEGSSFQDSNLSEALINDANLNNVNFENTNLNNAELNDNIISSTNFRNINSTNLEGGDAKQVKKIATQQEQATTSYDATKVKNIIFNGAIGLAALTALGCLCNLIGLRNALPLLGISALTAKVTYNQDNNKDNKNESSTIDRTILYSLTGAAITISALTVIAIAFPITAPLLTTIATTAIGVAACSGAYLGYYDLIKTPKFIKNLFSGTRVENQIDNSTGEINQQVNQVNHDRATEDKISTKFRDMAKKVNNLKAEQTFGMNG